MNLNLIYSTLAKIFDLYELDDISSSISAVHTSLKNLSSQPQNVSYQKAYSDAEKQLFIALKPENFSSLTEFDVETLQHSGLTELLPGNVLKEVKQAQLITELTPSVIADSFQEIANRFDAALENAETLKSTLEKLGAEDIFDYNEAYLAFIMSSPEYKGEYGEYVKDQEIFEKGLRFILNGADVEDKTLRLHALSNTDPITIIAASPPAIFIICKVLQEVLKTIQEGKKVELFEAQIKTEKTRNKKLEAELEKHKKNKQAEAVTLIAKLFVGKGDGEKLTSLEKGIKLFMTCIAKGHGVDIIAGEYQDGEANEDGKPADQIGLTKNEYLEIVEISREVRKLAGNEVPQYLLEAPKEKDEDEDEVEVEDE